MTVVLSIVSGTFNRQTHLREMMLSARLALPAGIAYEFVIVDGGSTDGTLEWLKSQPDARVIEHGELRGAIPAFCDGANAAVGEYVLMANDDIVFHPASIVRAIRYLEDTPECGIVAFADDRPVPGYPASFKVQYTSAIMPDGRGCVVPYAQVALVRKWLGDMVGWWGADDPIMGKARTYGGDNYLSARCWELGYSVDEVPGAQVSDKIPADNLRRINTAQAPGMHPDSAAYLERFPHGAQIVAKPTVNGHAGRHLRILYLPIYEPGHEIQRLGKAGLRRALKKVGWVYELDYLSEPSEAIALAIKAWKPDIMLCQFQDATNVTPDRLGYWRRLAPGMLVVNWHGDARGHDEPAYLDLLKHVDVQLVVNAAALDICAAHGIKAAYWQIGYEFPQGELPEVKAHDVVFQANAYSDERKLLEARLEPYDVGFYGSGWAVASGNTLYDFASGEAVYKAAKIAISDTFPGQRAFVSNRFFQALAAGVFLLQQTIPDFEQYTGLKEGVHYVEWSDLDDLTVKIAYWLLPENAKRRKQIARNGQRYVQAHYSFDALVRQLFVEILPKALEVERELQPV
jgi:glycosyltransferase involved in cell wall biosynthesis